ncbi:hypothetical protein ACIBEJ_00740 [Nonomuraea sp. NPDC050790]|uniref:hypothetical protein n=1 Tax=Nonomuraea sp. NPDC050790 TaxID=3364371 RepID=UPI0037B36D5B
MNTPIRPSRAAELTSRIEAIKAAALELDTSDTEQVTAGDLEPADVILSLNGRQFPFPFTLSDVRPILTYGLVLTATHGWFTPNPLPRNTPVVRLARINQPPAWPDLIACDLANRDARFLPMAEDTLPCLEVAGVQVYLYLDAELRVVQVSVNVDEPRPGLLRADATVPLRVDVGHTTVFDDSDRARAAQPTPRQMLQRLVDEQYGGDATKALLDLADIGPVAVNYLDREWFASYLKEFHGAHLTEEGWAALAGELAAYDEHVCGYTQPNVQNAFAEKVVLAAGLINDDL